MPYGREDEYTGMEGEEWEILSQNMPNVSDEERSQAFQEYKEQKHWAEREGEPYDIYEFLQGMGIDTNQNLPPEVQGRMQQGRQQHPGHFIKRGNEPKPEIMQNPELDQNSYEFQTMKRRLQQQQQGLGQPEMMQEMPTSLMQQYR